MPRGAAIMRGDLDEAIVASAIQRGCEFISGCSASLLAAKAEDSFRTLKIQSSEGTREIRAGVVIAADGIGGTLLAGEPWAKWTISRGAWMGVATTFEADSVSSTVLPGRVYMHLGNNGMWGWLR